MKKKIILTFTLIIALICVFAASVCATTIYKNENGEEMFRFEMDSANIISEHTGSFPKTDSDGDALTWYVISTATVDGNTIKTVKSMKTLDSNYSSLSNGEYKYTTSTVTNLNVVSACFPSDAGITKITLANGGYKNSTDYSPTATEILFVYLPSTLTEMPERIVQGSKALVCEIPSNMPITSIHHCTFYQAKCLKEITIPSTLTIIPGKSKNDGTAFYGCTSLERVTFGENSQLKEIQKQAFYECVNLKYITIPNSVLTIGEHAFTSTALINSPFQEGSLCQTIGGRAFDSIKTLKTFIVPAGLTKVDIYGDMDYGPLSGSVVEHVYFGNAIDAEDIVLQPSFFGRATIDEITFSEGITHIPNRYFIQAKLTDVKLPNTLETIEERAFQSATVQSIRFGASFKYFVNTLGTDGHHALTHASSGIKEIYLPASFYAEAPSEVYRVSYAFQCSGLPVKFFYAGTKEQLDVSMNNFLNKTSSATDTNWPFINATQVSYSDYLNEIDKYQDKNCIIYDYNVCDAFYESNHDEGAEVTYFKGAPYTSDFCSLKGCARCKQGTETFICGPLFDNKGYSRDTAGTAFAYGISLYRSEIEKYQAKTGNEITYGFILGLADAENPLEQIIDKDGNALIENSIVADLTDVIFQALNIYNIKMTNITTDAQRALPIYCNAYVIEVEKVSYIGSVNEKYAPVFVKVETMPIDDNRNS